MAIGKSTIGIKVGELAYNSPKVLEDDNQSIMSQELKSPAPSDIFKNLGGRPPNPKFKVEPKEFDLIKWVADRHHIKDPGEFAKRIVMNYCKNYYLEQKKKAEEKKIQEELKKEKEQEELIEEIESDGGIEKQKKYIRTHQKGENWAGKDPDAPIPEGATIMEEYE